LDRSKSVFICTRLEEVEETSRIAIMPTFDFICEACTHTFEFSRPFGSKEEPLCPECGGKAHKQIAPPAIQFKGEGFYKTDSAPKPAQEKEEAPKPEKEEPKEISQKESPKSSEKQPKKTDSGTEKN
jgi:putative FmdB family regulatory protein